VENCYICNSGTGSTNLSSSEFTIKSKLNEDCQYCLKKTSLKKGENCDHFYCDSCGVDHKQKCFKNNEKPDVSISVKSEESSEPIANLRENQEKQKQDPSRLNDSKHIKPSKYEQESHISHYETNTITESEHGNDKSNKNSRTGNDQETKKCCLLL
jgi:hypothetical protein